MCVYIDRDLRGCFYFLNHTVISVLLYAIYDSEMPFLSLEKGSCECNFYSFSVMKDVPE